MLQTENTLESWNFIELKTNNIMSLILQKNRFLISVYENVLTYEKTDLTWLLEA
jgi:hypothetical protein